MLYFYDDPPVWIPTQSESALNTINHLCAPSRGKRVRRFPGFHGFRDSTQRAFYKDSVKSYARAFDGLNWLISKG